MNFAALKNRLVGKKVKLVLAAADDSTAVEALKLAYSLQIIEPVLIGDPDKIIPLLERNELMELREAIIAEPTPEAAAALAFKMAADGRSDLVMKGHVSTPTLLKAALAPENGFAQGNLLSHVALFELPMLPSLLCLTDTGMILKPDLAQKIGIIDNAVAFMRRLGIPKPVVAVVSATETPNPKMQCSMDAVELTKMAETGRFPDAVIWGPVDVSIALDPQAAIIKNREPTWSGKTDIWLVPEMIGGNILGKSLMYLAKAAAGGAIVGGKKPIVLLSRASDAEEKFNSILLGIAAAKGVPNEAV